ncbi:MAG: HAMP domain-containing protein, partial [Candidatus Caldatribacteriaceae bacterium]
MKKTLFTKLLFSYFLVVTISYAVLGLSLSLLFSHYYFSLREKELLKRGEDLLALLTQDTNSRFEILEVARRLTQGVFITLMSKEDFLREYLIPPRNFMQRMWRSRVYSNFPQKLWETIQKGKHASWQNFHPILRQDVLSVAIPVQKNKNVVAALILATPLANIQTTVRTVEYFILFSGIISLSFSLLLAFWLSSSLTRPLRKMSEIARQLAQGNFQEKITIHTQDEVSQLAQDFNILSENLRETIEKLREEKERTENIFLHMSEGIMAIDSEKQIVSLNSALQKTLSLQNQEIHSLNDLHLGEEIEKTFAEVLLRGKEREKEFELSNGKNVIFHITPLKENQIVKGAVAVIQDITELRKVDKLRMEFIANVSHELRTPLTSIQGFLEAAIDEVIPFTEWKDKYLPLLHNEI